METFVCEDFALWNDLDILPSNCQDYVYEFRIFTYRKKKKKKVSRRETQV